MVSITTYTGKPVVTQIFEFYYVTLYHIFLLCFPEGRTQIILEVIKYET